MADDCDVSSEEHTRLEDMHLQERLRQREHVGASAMHCEDCGGEISADRREAARGCRRCVDCEAIDERRRRRYSRVR